jgi:hypothetical protein
VYRLLCIIPAVSAAITYLIIGIEEWWPLYVAATIIGEVVVIWAMYRIRRDIEYLSGYATAVYHHEAWTERVVRHETYTDSKGNTHTRTVVDYVEHPDEWFCILNTGCNIDIEAESYYQICNKWETEEEWIDPPHSNCVAGGGGQMK